MVFIWEDYEKEMNRQHQGFSDRTDFKYPPILPIVYYEGEEKWTAPMDLSERILCGELLGKYLPYFKYQLVRLFENVNMDMEDVQRELLRIRVRKEVQRQVEKEVLRERQKAEADEQYRKVLEEDLDIR